MQAKWRRSQRYRAVVAASAVKVVVRVKPVWNPDQRVLKPTYEVQSTAAAGPHIRSGIVGDVLASRE